MSLVNEEKVPATLPQLISAMLMLKNDKAMIAYLRDETGEVKFGKPCLDPVCDELCEKFPEQCKAVDFIHESTFDIPLIDYVDVESATEKKTVIQLDVETLKEFTKNGITVLVHISHDTMEPSPSALISYDLGDLIV